MKTQVPAASNHSLVLTVQSPNTKISMVLLDSLLFKLVSIPEKEAALLAIPKICVDKIIALYHASLFAGHQGVLKMYLTMKEKFFVPGLMHYLRSFIK